ncbi:hypothetical protein LJC16_02245 [Bacteroidales bacterium OttesenSCG-928-C19]|nr:hypothetical protein [Bacteroidales bacterium OttesenSCG-928-C19]
MAKRSLSTGNLYQKVFKLFDFEGFWADVFGQPERGGFWLIWGKEKNGKTWIALLLAYYLSTKGKTLYISAEEGIGKEFVDTCKRIGLDPANRNLQFWEYEPIEDLEKRLAKRNSEEIVFIDNVTVYNEELKSGKLEQLRLRFPQKTFIFLAHEDRKEPYTATAKMIKRLAKIIIYAEGLAGIVSGRCPGGRLVIDEEKACLYHGTEIINQNKEE